LSLLVTKDEGLKKYLGQVLAQLSSWLLDSGVQKLVLVVASVASKEVLERWVFDIQSEKAPNGNGVVEKSEKEITKEIQALIRQITASVSYLPLLDELCTFDLLVYTDAAVAVPQTWEESDPRYIAKSMKVRLRSFSTTIHKVDALVTYKDDT